MWTKMWVKAWMQLGGAALGAILGVAVVKALFLDVLEETAFRLFWDGPTSFPIEQVIHSDTFVKCLLGAVVGLFIGLVVANALSPSVQRPENDVEGGAAR